jgi:hypothetical protein
VSNTMDSLPILHLAHPIWYQGRLAAVAANGEVYAVGWVEPGQRPVLRAMALAVFEAPFLAPDQQLGFAAYYLLPSERWRALCSLPDELIARQTGLPLDLIRRRRALPPLPGDETVVPPGTVERPAGGPWPAGTLTADSTTPSSPRALTLPVRTGTVGA